MKVSKDGAVPVRGEGFDAVCLSVGTQAQARLYEPLLPALRDRYGSDVRLLADGRDGKRCGSGGAVLQALTAAFASETAPPRKVMLILAGGECRRTANYALRGKAMIPAAEENGEPVSCLELVLKNALPLAGRLADGILVCCADIPVDFSGADCRFTQNTAFCVEAPTAFGTRHGVMFPAEDGALTEYLQKPSAGTLREAAQRHGMADAVPIDTGWVFFDAACVASLRRFAAEAEAEIRENAVGLYTDILPAMARSAPDFGPEGEPPLRAAARRILGPHPLAVFCLRQPFLHFGTTVELLRNVRRSTPQKPVLLNSLLGPGASAGEGSLLENALLTGACRVGRDCLVTDIELDGVEIPDRTSVFGVRLKNGSCVTVSFSIEATPEDAPETAARLWRDARFFPAPTFSESYRRFTAARSAPSAERITLRTCMRMADPDYFSEWRQYLSDTAKRSSAMHPRYAGCRSLLLDAFFAGRERLGVVRCRKDRVSLRLPVRINFSGTWTDCMPYCIDRGGEVINAPIAVNGRLPISVTAERIPEKRIEMRNAEAGGRAAVYKPDDVFSDFSAYNLHRAVFRTLGIDARTEIRDGVRLSVAVRGVMKGSGLGTSSILLYGCFAALGELLGIAITEEEILTFVFIAEQLMGTGGGWQDQGAVVGGGLRSVSSPPGLPQRIKSVRLPAAPAFLSALSDRLVLISTGQRHFGRFIVTDVMSRYLQNNPEAGAALQALTDLNGMTRSCIEASDLSGFAACMNAQHAFLSELSPLICAAGVRETAEKSKRYVDACCPCGAGGGGYLFALRKADVSLAEIQDSLQTEVLPISLIQEL